MRGGRQSCLFQHLWQKTLHHNLDRNRNETSVEEDPVAMVTMGGGVGTGEGSCSYEGSLRRVTCQSHDLST